jgi:hypothetical protein
MPIYYWLPSAGTGGPCSNYYTTTTSSTTTSVPAVCIGTYSIGNTVIWTQPYFQHVVDPSLIQALLQQQLQQQQYDWAQHADPNLAFFGRGDLPSPEEIARQAREADWERRERLERAAQIARNRETADRRARDLLFDHLTEAQRETIAKHGWFLVEGGKSKKKYRIDIAMVAGNIAELERERVTHRLCCHLEHVIPTHDHFLAQKLALEFDEERFLLTANRRRAAL